MLDHDDRCALGMDVPKHCDPQQKLAVRRAAQDFVEQQKARISCETSCEFQPLFSPSVGDDTKSKVVEKTGEICAEYPR